MTRAAGAGSPVTTPTPDSGCHTSQSSRVAPGSTRPRASAEPPATSSVASGTKTRCACRLARTIRISSTQNVIACPAISCLTMSGGGADQRSGAATTSAQCLDLGQHLGDRRLRVAEQHLGVLLVVELVLDAREAGVHRALEDDHRV